MPETLLTTGDKNRHRMRLASQIRESFSRFLALRLLIFLARSFVSGQPEHN